MAGVLKIEAASSRVGMLMPSSTKVALSCMRIQGFLGRNHRYDGHILGSMVDAVYYARTSKGPMNANQIPANYSSIMTGRCFFVL